MAHIGPSSPYISDPSSPYISDSEEFLRIMLPIAARGGVKH